MHPDKIRNPTLAQAEQAVKDARINLNQIALEIQAKCPHRLVFQAQNSRSSPRICPKCALQVESYSTAIGVSHWTARDFQKSPLNNHEDRIVTIIDSEEFYKLTIKN